MLSSHARSGQADVLPESDLLMMLLPDVSVSTIQHPSSNPFTLWLRLDVTKYVAGLRHHVSLGVTYCTSVISGGLYTKKHVRDMFHRSVCNGYTDLFSDQAGLKS